MRVYLDSAPVIYAVERVSGYVAEVDAILSAADVVQVASDLTRLECRVKPIRDSDRDLLADYDEYFGRTVSEIVALSRVVVDRATEIRASYGFRTPDAIHLASALESNCDLFLTNDHRLDRFPDIAVQIVESQPGIGPS